MADTKRLQEGYLILADISGYTAFLAGSELEHAQEITGELLNLILDHIKPPMKLIQLEGDALYFYVLGSAFLEGERLIELLESCYFDFADHLVAMQRGTTCRCAACRAIPTLDLKFVVHYGSFIVQQVAGHESLIGSDPIVAHLLLKNHISERIGHRAYLFLTDRCLAKINPALPVLHHSETYEHLGEVNGGIHDLKLAWQAMCESRREYIDPDEADVAFEYLIPAPPPIAWDYLVNPEKNVLLQDDLLKMENKPRPDGRMGAGARTHCAHGTYMSLHKYLDWRPFHYFTEWLAQTSETPSPLGPPPAFQTWEFTPVGVDHTFFTLRFRLEDRESPALADLAFLTEFVQGHYLGMMQRLDRLLADDGLLAAPAEPPDAEAGSPGTDS
jgi:hypothetical protein